VAEGPPATVITEDLFAEVFGIRVAALPHPIHGRPYFVPA
jgi:ABC-type cobalamin/Fe3+-siderophores transport system ATPase subunit